MEQLRPPIFNYGPVFAVGVGFSAGFFVTGFLVTVFFSDGSFTDGSLAAAFLVGGASGVGGSS